MEMDYLKQSIDDRNIFICYCTYEPRTISPYEHTKASVWDHKMNNYKIVDGTLL